MISKKNIIVTNLDSTNEGYSSKLGSILGSFGGENIQVINNNIKATIKGDLSETQDIGLIGYLYLNGTESVLSENTIVQDFTGSKRISAIAPAFYIGNNKSLKVLNNRITTNVLADKEASVITTYFYGGDFEFIKNQMVTNHRIHFWRRANI